MELMLMNWPVGQVISFGFIRKASYGVLLGSYILRSVYSVPRCSCSRHATTSIVLSSLVLTKVPWGSVSICENHPITKMREIYGGALTATTIFLPTSKFNTTCHGAR
jgi:hypothetical protein